MISLHVADYRSRLPGARSWYKPPGGNRMRQRHKEAPP
jgi:hypothetical protein